VVTPAKNSVKVLLDKIIFYKFELQNFKPIFVRRKTIFWGFSKVLSPQKVGSPNLCTNHQNILDPQIATPQSATFAESP
jgi:hypothetical protein